MSGRHLVIGKGSLRSIDIELRYSGWEKESETDHPNFTPETQTTGFRVRGGIRDVGSLP